MKARLIPAVSVDYDDTRYRLYVCADRFHPNWFYITEHNDVTLVSFNYYGANLKELQQLVDEKMLEASDKLYLESIRPQVAQFINGLAADNDVTIYLNGN